ncbi:MFS transporter [Cronobacter dublinensis]|nr:MFS transporter [Cronobacter dublinensis]
MSANPFSRTANAAAALSVLSAAMILPLSFTGGVATTPAIGHELGGSALSLAWLTNGFMLTFGSSLLAAGVMADLTGRKRIFTGGLMLFFVSCLAVCLATSTATIGVLRAVQGVAAAMTLAGGSAMLAQLFEGQARTRVFSVLGTMFGAGLAFGPLLAGLIIDHDGWRCLYALLAALAGLCALTGAIFLPPAVKTSGGQADVPGLALFSVCLVCFTVALLAIPPLGVTSWPVLALLGASLAAAKGVIVRCRRATHPVFDLALLRNARFAGVLLLPLATCCCYVVWLILLPLRFTGAEALSETRSALYMLALTLPVLLLPGVAALLTRWFSAASLAAGGLLVAAIGLVLLGVALQGNSDGRLIMALVVTGCGSALPWGLMDGLAVSGVPAQKAGMAAGLFNTVRVAGESVALVCVMAFLATASQQALAATLNGYSPQTIASAAAWLGAGHLEQAHTLLPGVPLARLHQSLNQAYQWLCNLLAILTLLCAATVWKTLRRHGPPPGRP